jgi:hypothetical protein
MGRWCGSKMSWDTAEIIALGAFMGLGLILLPLHLIKTGITLRNPNTKTFEKLKLKTRQRLSYGYILSGITIWLSSILSFIFYSYAPELMLFSELLCCFPLVVLTIYVGIVDFGQNIGGWSRSNKHQNL